MKAAVLKEFNQPLVVQEVPDPRPGSGEVLVRVDAVGICGTDLKIRSGVFDLALPLVPGHEIAGEIIAIGDGVASERVGQRVACYYYSTCMECPWCLLGQQNLCTSVRRLGFERNGGMAEMVVLGANEAIPLPEGVEAAVGAVAMDAVTTPWRALKRKLLLQPNEHLVVIGAGGLGLNAIQVGVALGARVAVVEPEETRRSYAAGVGAEEVVGPDEAASLRIWADGMIDVVLEVSGSQGGLNTAVSLVRPGGRIGVVGYRADTELSAPTARVVLDELQIIGCRGGSVEDATEALQAIDNGQIHAPIAEIIPLEEINQALDRLTRADFVGRIVLRP